MANSSQFPAFVQLRVAEDGTAKTAFLQQVASTLAPAKQSVREFSGDIQRELDRALAPPKGGQFAASVRGELASANREVAAFAAQAQRNLAVALKGGGVDLGVADLRAAAAAQQQRAAAARE